MEFTYENLRKWFKEEDWVRIDTQGNITGKCGTMKKGKKTTRCLPRAKANSLSKKERAATARKKTRSKKQFVKNTKKAKVKLKKEITMPTNLSELKEELLNKIEEGLCKKGKAYVARRKAAGEKHGAYLMGRAVKVCKGQMSGKKKKKKKNEANTPSGDMAYTQKVPQKDESLIQEIKQYYIDNVDEVQMIEDALNEEVGYCPLCASQMNEGRKKKKCKPSKGKRFAKRVNGKCRSFGQKGKASDGGDRIRPGTKKAHAYCARSAKIKKCKNPPCANTLSRKKWKCQGSRSVAESSLQERFMKLANLVNEKI